MFSSFGMSSFGDEPTVYFESVKETLFLLEQKLGLTILIYGSVARHGCGNDLDMIIVGTEEMWQDFRKKVLQKSPAWSGAIYRGEVANKMVEDALDELEEECHLLIDVYIFPPDWLKRLDELQATFPHEDPGFMRNIAVDVKTLGECAIKAARMS